jgi:hypothetical protein
VSRDRCGRASGRNSAHLRVQSRVERARRRTGLCRAQGRSWQPKRASLRFGSWTPPHSCNNPKELMSWIRRSAGRIKSLAADPIFTAGVRALRRARVTLRSVDLPSPAMHGSVRIPLDSPRETELSISGEKYRLGDFSAIWCRLMDVSVAASTPELAAAAGGQSERSPDLSRQSRSARTAARSPRPARTTPCWSGTYAYRPGHARWPPTARPAVHRRGPRCPTLEPFHSDGATPGRGPHRVRAGSQTAVFRPRSGTRSRHPSATTRTVSRAGSCQRPPTMIRKIVRAVTLATCGLDAWLDDVRWSCDSPTGNGGPLGERCTTSYNHGGNRNDKEDATTNAVF